MNGCPPTAPIADFLRRRLLPGEVVELRVLGVRNSKWENQYCGFYDVDHIDELAKAAAQYSYVNKARGVYVTINPVSPDLLSRLNNRSDFANKDDGTKDHEVVRRRFILVDVDSVRAAGISATDDEKAAALALTRRVREHLDGLGWPAPIFADSGNGYHLQYAVDLPADDGRLVKRFLDALAEHFAPGDDDAIKVKVDTSVGNASRIGRLYGTWARKGDSTPHRPHRLSAVLEYRDDLQIVPTELIEAIAGPPPEPTKPSTNGSHKANGDGMSFGLPKPEVARLCLAALKASRFDDRGQWLNIGRACHDADPSIEMRDLWISRSEKSTHYKEGDGIKEWAEFKVGGGTTLGTLILFAKENGWIPPAPKQRSRRSASVATPVGAADNRPEVTVVPDEYQTNDEAAAALALDLTLYQQAGQLSQIVRNAEFRDGILRPEGTPRVVAISSWNLRERLTARARFIKLAKDGDGNTVKVQVNPPEWCVNAVMARGSWPGVRPLTAIVHCPVLRHDGSIIQSEGYDPSTGLYLDPSGEWEPIPDHPTKDDAQQALAMLLDVVCDFPFDKPEHRSVWLAAILTLFARHVFSGPSPLFLFDANVRGSGKSLLADLVSLIFTGRPAPRFSNPGDDDEARKRITAVALAGDPIILIDNIAGTLGSAALDAALTAEVWQDRILGKSEIVTLPLRAVWLASGNNVVLGADTSRRIAHSRIKSPLEYPEKRTEFKYPDIKAHVRQNRPRLLCAALTILRAWFVAGKPKTTIPSWGSYEGWSDIVRQAVVWLGLPDPAETRKELADTSDREAGALRQLIHGWAELDPTGEGLTSGEIVARVTDPEAIREGRHLAVRSALGELCSRIDPRAIGNRLKHLRDRVCDGMSLTCKPDSHTKVNRWKVEPAGASAGSAVAAVCSPSPLDVHAHAHTRADGVKGPETHAADPADTAMGFWDAPEATPSHRPERTAGDGRTWRDSLQAYADAGGMR